MVIELIHFSGLCDAQLVGQLEESTQGCLGRRLCLQLALIKQLYLLLLNIIVPDLPSYLCIISTHVKLYRLFHE